MAQNTLISTVRSFPKPATATPVQVRRRFAQWLTTVETTQQPLVIHDGDRAIAALIPLGLYPELSSLRSLYHLQHAVALVSPTRYQQLVAAAEPGWLPLRE